jgi:hypothetical protein
MIIHSLLTKWHRAVFDGLLPLAEKSKMNKTPLGKVFEILFRL